MKVCINKDYEQFRHFIEEIPNYFDNNGTMIYNGRRNKLKSFEVGGTLINVKSYRVPIFINRIIYTWFRKSKAERAYQHGMELIAKGFKTPDPIAYVETKRCGLLHRSFFISLHTPLDGHMRLFNDSDVNNDGKEQLIKEFALFTAKLHESGVLHCDYSPGNILYGKIADEGDHQYEFSLVDINRMQFKPVSVEMGCENFARMRGNDDFFKTVATYYAKARNYDVESCVEKFLHYKREDRARRAKKERFKQLRKKIFA